MVGVLGEKLKAIHDLLSVYTCLQRTIVIFIVNMKLLEFSVLLFGIDVFICFLKFGILIDICNLLANKRLYFVGCN